LVGAEWALLSLITFALLIAIAIAIPTFSPCCCLGAVAIILANLIHNHLHSYLYFLPSD
jgi:hypothetical protein